MSNILTVEKTEDDGIRVILDKCTPSDLLTAIDGIVTVASTELEVNRNELLDNFKEVTTDE